MLPACIRQDLHLRLHSTQHFQNWLHQFRGSSRQGGSGGERGYLLWPYPTVPGVERPPEGVWCWSPDYRGSHRPVPLCKYIVYVSSTTPNREIISTYFLFVYIRFEKKISSINFILRDKLQIYIALQFLSSWWWCFGGVPGEGVLFFLSFLLYFFFFWVSIELSSFKRKEIYLFAILFRQRLIFPS